MCTFLHIVFLIVKDVILLFMYYYCKQDVIIKKLGIIILRTNFKLF